MGLIFEKKSGDAVKAEKQKHIDTIRKGGFAKMADREQRKLDKKGK